MNRNEENINRYIIEQRMNDIRSQLINLNHSFAVNYILGFAYPIDENNLNRNIFYNRFINLKLLDDFIMDLIELRRDMVRWLNLIHVGAHVVYCNNDEDQDNNLDSVLAGRYYLVNEIIVLPGRELEFILVGMDSGSKTGGYSSSRFIRMFSATIQN